MGKKIATVGSTSIGSCVSIKTAVGNKVKCYAEGKLMIVDGNPNVKHMTDPTTVPTSCITPHVTKIKSTSTSVLVGGKAVARDGDTYIEDTTCAMPAIEAIQGSVKAG